MRPLSHPGAFKSLYFVETKDDDRWTAQVKLDIDTARNPLRIRNMRTAAWFMADRGLTTTRLEAYRTRKGFHVRIWFEGSRWGHRTVLRIQSLLGDDLSRQKFNAARVRRGEANWQILWTAKWRNGVLKSHEVHDPVLTARLRPIFGLTS